MDSFIGQPGYLKNTWRNSVIPNGFPRPGASPFGVIVEDTFTAISGSYSTAGGATFASDGTDLTMSGGSPYTSRIMYNYSQSFEEWRITAQFQINFTPGASTFGVGFGHFDQNTPENSFVAFLDASNGANAGKARIVRTSSPVLATATNTITSLASGNIFNVVMERKILNNFGMYTISVTRVSDGLVSSTSFTEIPLISQPSYLNATGRFAMWSLGGSIKVFNWKVEAFDLKDTDILFIGDSITHGLMAGDLSKRFANLVGGSFSVSAGSSDVTQMVVNKFINIRAFNPQKVVLSIGTNDVAFGVADATLKANYTNIVNTLTSYGIEVILCLQLPRNGVSIKPFNDWIQLTFKNNAIVDWYTPMNNNGNLRSAYNADNTHPNPAGHELMASLVRLEVGLKNAR